MLARTLLWTTAALCACTGYDPQLGQTPFYCGDTDPKCPDGYTCMASGTGSGVCTMGSPPGPGSGHCNIGGAGQLALWDLTGQLGDEVSAASTMALAGVTAQPLARSPSLTPSPGTNSISSSNWPTASVPGGGYYTMSLAVPSGCSLSLSSVMLDVASSGTGPTSAVLSTSEDGFSQQVPVSTTAPGNVSISVTAAGGTLELRVFGFAAAATGGTMRIQNQLVLTGTVQ